MSRLIGFFVVIIAFGAGLATGALHYSAVPFAPVALQPQVDDLQRRMAVLQQRLHEQDAELTALRQRRPTHSEARSAGRSTWRPSSAPTQGDLRVSHTPPSSPTHEEDDLPASDAPAPAPPTEQAALNRLYHYLEDTEGLNPRQRQERVRALIDELRAMGEPAVTALIQVLDSGENSRERRVAASLLGALQDVRALPALQDVLEREPDLMMRRAAANGLRQLQHPETLPVLEKTLANTQDDRFIRISAAYGLAQLGDTQGTEGLMQIFSEAEDDGQGRFPAFRALMALNDPAALPLMRQLAVSDADVSYRVAAMRFLARQGDQEALPVLQELMASPREQASILDAAAQTHEAITSGKRPAPTGDSRSREALFDIGLGPADPPRRR